MSFESNRSKGRISTLLIVLLPIIMIIFYASVRYLLHFSASDTFYLLVISPIIACAVYILFLSAMNGFAKYYEDSRIFKNALYAFIVSVSSAITVLVIEYALLIPIVEQLAAYTTTPSSVPLPLAWSFLAVMAITLLGLAVVGILNGFLYRRAFHALAEKSGENNFKQAGLLILIGGVLMIILVGVFVVLIGWIFAVLGFSSMKPRAS